MTNKLTHLHSRNTAFPFVIFDNDMEKETFIDYIVQNENLLHEIKPDIWGEFAKDNMVKEKKSSVIDPIFIDKVTQLHQKWAGHNNKYRSLGG